MREQGKELLVGAVISAALIVGIVGTLWLQGANLGQTVTMVQVWVTHVAGLTEGNPVVFRGVPIGQVSEISLDSSGGFARVMLELEGEVQLEEDSQALLLPQSFFGDWQLEILSRSRFPRVEFFDVPPGYQEEGVRVIGGYAVPDMSQLTLVASDIAENIAVLTNRFDRAFSEETAENLAQVVENVERLSVEINEMIQQQAETFDRVGADVERAATELGEAASVGRVTLQRLDAVLARGDIDSILVNVRTATRSTGELVEEFRESRAELSAVLARADTTLASVGVIANRIESGEGTLGQLIMSDSLSQLARGAVRALEVLLQDIRTNPGRYLRLSIF